MSRRPTVRTLLGTAALGAALGLPWFGTGSASAAQAACTPSAFQNTVTDPDTGIAYTFPVDNPTTCSEGGPADPFVATLNGTTWTFGTPASVQPGFAAVPATGITCTKVIEYVARGTLEDLDEYTNGTTTTKSWGLHGLAADHGAGVVGEAVYDQLSQLYPAGSTSLYADYYPADDLLSAGNATSISQRYVASVNYGAAQAVKDLNLLRASCPASRLLVVGYSQGADAIRHALASSALSSSVASPAVTVEFFGDPNFTPTEQNVPGSPTYTAAKAAVVLNGAFAYGRSGLEHGGQPLVFPAAPAIPARFTVGSWCHDQELVCQGFGTNLNQHLDYGTVDGYAAARFAASSFGRTSAPSGAPTVPTVATPTGASFGSSCVKVVPGTTQVVVSLGDTGSPTASSLTRSVGYSAGGVIRPVAGTAGTTALPAGSTTSWTQNLPFVLGQTHFLFDAWATGVPNPLATAPDGTHPNQIVYEGFFDPAC